MIKVKISEICEIFLVIKNKSEIYKLALKVSPALTVKQKLADKV